MDGLARIVDGNEGVRLRVVEYPDPGNGYLPFPIVLVPGWVAHLDTWQGVIDNLRVGCKVYYLETRDKPSSSVNSKSSYAIADQAKDIPAVLSNLGLADHSFYIAGASTGANIVLQYLLDGICQPRAAALMLPMKHYHFPLRGIPYLAFPPVFVRVLKPLAKTYITHFASDPSGERQMLKHNIYSIDRLEPRRTMGTARALNRYRFPSGLGEVEVPSLLVQAKHDRMHKSVFAEEITRLMPNADLMEVPEAGFIHTADMGPALLGFFSRH